MFDIGLCQLSDEDLLSELERRYPHSVFAACEDDEVTEHSDVVVRCQGEGAVLCLLMDGVKSVIDEEPI